MNSMNHRYAVTVTQYVKFQITPNISPLMWNIWFATHGTTEIRPVEGSRQSLGQNTISNSSRYADKWTTGESGHTDEGIQVPLHRCGSDTSTVLSHHNKGVMHYLNNPFLVRDTTVGSILTWHELKNCFQHKKKTNQLTEGSFWNVSGRFGPQQQTTARLRSLKPFFTYTYAACEKCWRLHFPGTA